MNNDKYTVTEVADLVSEELGLDTKPSKIRLYTDKFLGLGRALNNYRYFDKGHIKSLCSAVILSELGFALEFIKSFIHNSNNPYYLEKIQDRIGSLKRLMRYLK